MSRPVGLKIQRISTLKFSLTDDGIGEGGYLYHLPVDIARAGCISHGGSDRSFRQLYSRRPLNCAPVGRTSVAGEGGHADKSRLPHKLRLTCCCPCHDHAGERHSSLTINRQQQMRTVGVLLPVQRCKMIDRIRRCAMFKRQWIAIIYPGP